MGAETIEIAVSGCKRSKPASFYDTLEDWRQRKRMANAEPNEYRACTSRSDEEVGEAGSRCNASRHRAEPLRPRAGHPERALPQRVGTCAPQLQPELNPTPSVGFMGESLCISPYVPQNLLGPQGKPYL